MKSKRLNIKTPEGVFYQNTEIIQTGEEDRVERGKPVQYFFCNLIKRIGQESFLMPNTERRAVTCQPD